MTPYLSQGAEPDMFREKADALWQDLLPLMQVESEDIYGDKVAALALIEGALFAAREALAARIVPEGVTEARLRSLDLPTNRKEREALVQHHVQVVLNGHPYTRYSYVAQNEAVERERATRYARGIARSAVDRALADAITSLAPALAASATANEAVTNKWDGHPTPSEAAALLRKHAREKRLPPNDNDYDDAASVIDRLIAMLLASSPPGTATAGASETDWNEVDAVERMIATLQRTPHFPSSISIAGGIDTWRDIMRKALLAAAPATQSRVKRLETALSEIVATTCNPNPTDPARIDVAKGKHKAFESAIRAAVQALGDRS